MEMDLKVILSIVGSLFAAYFWLYNNTKTNLQQSLYRKDKIKLIEAHTFEEKYKTNLQGLISWIDNIYDNSTLIQNYSRHVTLALLYSFMVFILFWVLGSEGKVGTLEVMGNITAEVKIKIFIVFTLYILFIYFFYNKANDLINYLIKKLPERSQKSNIIRNIITLLGVVGVVVVGGVVGGVVVLGGEVVAVVAVGGVGGVGVVVLGVVVLGGEKNSLKNILQKTLIVFLIWFSITLIYSSFSEALNVASIITLISLPTIFSLKKFGLGLNLIFLGLMLLAVTLYNSDLNTNSYISILFLIILPLTNSLLDYISLKISKYMAEQIMSDNSILTVLLHLLADIIIAIIFLLALALFLHFSIEILNIFIDEPIPMKAMLIATWHDPFSIENGWITFMLLSTLIPTIIHLVLALGALFIAIMPSTKSLENLKRYNKGQEALLESAAHYFTRIAFLQTFFSFVILALLSLPFWYEKL
ncbi:MAG: Unknown protein [uncultured Sulfurovum sp.]|uniref:Uncharacterized protein n=1 Tax=uncultured Sulfurovum sp. TaxID=269237 RepID=A0A6S6U9I7_9BACT|nr:MAG: Unknown protein [uncultured Sulfurovum sp.]